MATLFHWAFEFIRIGILSLIYGFVIWWILTKGFSLKKLNKKVMMVFIFIALFVWRNSYWRDNGSGDFARVPLTSEYEVTTIDFWMASIKKHGENLHPDGDTNGIEKLYVQDGILYGQVGERFLIFNTQNGSLQTGLTKDAFAKHNGDIKKLVKPDKFHSAYWSWKLLLF